MDKNNRDIIISGVVFGLLGLIAWIVPILGLVCAVFAFTAAFRLLDTNWFIPIAFLAALGLIASLANGITVLNKNSMVSNETPNIVVASTPDQEIGYKNCTQSAEQKKMDDADAIIRLPSAEAMAAAVRISVARYEYSYKLCNQQYGK